MTTDLVVSNGEHVASAQAGGVGHQNPCGQQRGVRAVLGATLHPLGLRQPPEYLLVRQCSGAWFRNFDAPDRPEYTLVHVTFFRRVAHERPQHAAMVGNCGGRQVFQRLIKILVNVVGRQVAGGPRQSSAQDGELLQVSGAPVHGSTVVRGKVQKFHAEYSQRGREYPHSQQASSRQKNRYNRHPGQLAQLSSGAFPIIRAAYVAALCACLWLHRTESALGLLVLGQFAEAFKELLPRRG